MVVTISIKFLKILAICNVLNLKLQTIKIMNKIYVTQNETWSAILERPTKRLISNLL
jgi:hypothetical protein